MEAWDVVPVTYRLSNQGQVRTTICVSAWNDYEFVGADGTQWREHGIPTVYAKTDVLQLPAGAVLEWTTAIVAPNLRIGPAEFYLYVWSDCGHDLPLQLRSGPVSVLLVAPSESEDRAG